MYNMEEDIMHTCPICNEDFSECPHTEDDVQEVYTLMDNICPDCGEFIYPEDGCACVNPIVIGSLL